jgi:hypothetical protein
MSHRIFLLALSRSENPQIPVADFLVWHKLPPKKGGENIFINISLTLKSENVTRFINEISNAVTVRLRIMRPMSIYLR